MAVAVGAGLVNALSPAPSPAAGKGEEDLVFESASELFGLLSTPIRLKIVSAVCNGERNVSELIAQIGATQSNMSRHLSTLYSAGVLAKRREGTQIFYSLRSETVATLCRTVCTEMALDIDKEEGRPTDFTVKAWRPVPR